MRNTDKLGLVVPTNKATENFSTQDYVDNFDKIDNFAAAIDLSKVDKVDGKGLSTEDYTTAEKAKVANLPLDTNAQLADMARNSKNEFDKNSVAIGYRVDAATGNLISAVGWAVTGFIPVLSQTQYAKSHNSIVAEYNSAETFLAIGSNNALPFNTRFATSYIRISLDISLLDLYQLEKGGVSTQYEPYGVIAESTFTTLSDEDMSKNAIGKTLSLIPLKSSEYPDNIIDISPEISKMVTLGSFIKKDYVNSWGIKPYGIQIGVPSAKVASITQEYSVPHSIAHAQAVGMWYYIDNPENLISITLYLGHELTGFQWFRSDYTFKKGWNLFRHQALTGIIGNWSTFYRCRFIIEATGAVNVTIGKIFLEQPEKAKLLFVNDGGFVEFLDRGYLDLKARGIPTTWALNPGILGTARRITETQVDALANDFISEFSFHSWASEVHSTMTSEQIADNAIKCVRWLRKKGLKPDYVFRAAITQNNAPNHAILQQIVDAYANADELSGTEIFPFENPYGVKRLTLHGMDSARIDEIFDGLKKTHCLMVGYTHGIGLDSVSGLQNTGDMTQAQWDYFLSKIDTALAEGWLEGVTYDRLRKRYERQSKGAGFETFIKATYV